MGMTPRIAGLLLAGAAALACVLAAAACGGGKSPAEEYAWVTVDASYAPKNSIEEYLKNDAVEKGLLPFTLRDYGRSAAVLKKFRGVKFAGATPTVLEMTFPGLEEWILVDIRYQNEKERDVQRTMLYVKSGGQWRLADSGRLMK